MMKWILLYISCIASLFSSEGVLRIDNSFSMQTSHPFQMLYEDKDASLTLEDVLSKEVFAPSNLYTTQITQSNIWTKFLITNTTNKVQPVYFRHPRAGIDEIDVYIFHENTLVASYELGDLREQQKHPFDYRYSMFLHSLEPQTTYTVISKFHSVGSYEVVWSLESPVYRTSYDSLELLIFGLFGGILIALATYNFFLFVSLKNISFFIYSLHVLTLLCFQYTYSGIVYQYFTGLNLKFLTASAFFLGFHSVGLSFLFTFFFFKIESASRLGTLVLSCFSVAMMVVIYFVSAIWYPKLFVLSRYSHYLMMAFLIILFAIAILMFKRKAQGSLYFFLGHGIHLSMVLFFVATVTFSYSFNAESYSRFALPFGIVFEMVFLSLALGEQLRFMQEEKQRNETLLLEQVRFSSIGQAVANITHQWRSPLSHLSSLFICLIATYKHDKKKFVQEFEASEKEIAQSIVYMEECISTFHNFYAYSPKHQLFSPQKEIETILKILNTKLILHTIDVELSIENTTIVTHKNAFSNLMVILLENAIEQFTLISKASSSPRTIFIRIYLKNKEVFCEIEDTAGGINPDLCKELFTTSLSTKIHEGLGRGLLIAKMLVEKQLLGHIEVSNVRLGALFKLHFPQQAHRDTFKNAHSAFLLKGFEK